jgi:hypothetical protein
MKPDLHTAFATVLKVCNTEAIYIGRGAPAKTSMKHPEAQFRAKV